MNKLLLFLTISIDEIFKRLNQEPKKRQQIVKSNEEDSLQTMLQTDDNGYILGGWSEHKLNCKNLKKNFKKKYYWLMKINSSGVIEWEKLYKKREKRHAKFHVSNYRSRVYFKRNNF